MIASAIMMSIIGIWWNPIMRIISILTTFDATLIVVNLNRGRITIVAKLKVMILSDFLLKPCLRGQMY